MEIVEGGNLTGKLLGLQIQSGGSFFSERTNESITYRGDKEHLDYWLKHRLPILIVLYNPASDTAYREQVTKDLAIDTRKGWKIDVPDSQVLSDEARRALELIADGPAYFLRLRELQFAAPWVELLNDGNILIVIAEEWVNKSSGRGQVTLLAEGSSFGSINRRLQNRRSA